MFGLSLGLWSSTILGRGGGGAPAFSPLSLFASGEEGAWYEPSQTTAFKSTTDLTPCDYSDGCGFLLDKSQGAGYSGGSFTGLGSNLIGATSASNWTAYGSNTVTDDGDAVVITFVDNQYGAGLPLSTLAPEIVDVSKRFLLEFEVKAVGGTASMRVLNFAGNSYTFSSVSSTYKTQRLYASWDGGGSIDLTTSGLGAGESIYIRNISVRELPGNHATQVTAGARPILARVPEGGRRNLLNDTENFVPATSNWAAANVGSVNPTVLANQDGDADRVTFGTIDATGDLSILRYSVDSLTTAGPTYTISIEIKANDAAQIGKTVFFYQNDATGVLTYAAHTLTSDYVRVSVTGTWASTTRFISLATNGGTGYFGGEGALTDTNAVALVRSVQLETGSTATAYQKVVSEYDITEAGVTSLEYLSFDGSDDFMTAGTNADWNYLHDGTGCEFIMGLTPSDAADTNEFQVAMSTNSGATNTVGMIFGAEDRSLVVNQGWSYTVLRGAGGTVTFTGRVADTITSLTGNYVVRGGHKSGETPEYFFYDDEVLEYSGSYANAPSTANSLNALTLGQAIGSGFYWSGNLFGLLIRDTQLSENQRTNASNYMANRSGVTL